MDVSIGNFLGSFGLSGLGAGLFGVGGVVLWWLIRRKRERLWLPTTRLVKTEHVPLPQLQVVRPPWLPFLSFLCLALLLLLTSLHPYELIYSPKDNDQPRVHVIVDLSPSVSAQISLADYRVMVGHILTSLLAKSKLSFSRSDGGAVIDIGSDDAIEKVVESLTFHRAGLRVGALLNQQIRALNDVDRMIVVSDDDAYSWGDANWLALQETMDIVWMPVQRRVRSQVNAFINEVHDVSTPGSNQVDVDVEMLRVGDKSTSEQAVLTAKHGDSNLSEVLVTFPAQKDRILVRMQWDLSTVDAAKGAGDHLTFQLGAISGEELTIDNEFYTALSSHAYRALLVGPSFGERFLDDPSFLLQSALNVVGVGLDRVDRIDTAAPLAKPHHVSIFLGGAGLGVDQFCPRLPLVKGQAVAEQQKIWLLPVVFDAQYEELCWCYARFALEDQAFNEKPPVFCNDLHTREQYIDVVSSLGGKQIGGDIGLADSALALRTLSKSERSDIITLTVPLSPRPGEGMGVVRLPLLIRAFLGLQGVMSADAQSTALSEWPRVADLSSSSILLRSIPMSLSNVPIGESLLNHAFSAKMPTVWSSLEDPSFASSLLHRKDKDATAWLKVILVGIVSALCLEVLSVLFTILKMRRSKLANTAVIVIILCAAKVPSASASDIQIQALGYSGIGQQTASKLADDVEARTSISFDGKIASYATFSTAAEEQGWLWVKSADLIKGKNGELNPRVVLWLRRGGFLILEQNLPEATLAVLTRTISGLRRGEGWQVIPPDHELMRSFHLLDVLPTCANSIWKGFQFDGRLAMIVIPYNFMESLLDRPQNPACAIRASHEQSVRAFINLLMVVLATDYKRDQIHLPEILKRLR